MANTPVYNIRIPQGIRAGLREVAHVDRRSVSNLINLVLIEYLERCGVVLCPVCDGHPVERIDVDGHPELCDACEGLGCIKDKKAQLSPTVSELR